MLLNTANDVISFLHKSKYRLMDIKSINKVLRANKENTLFKALIHNIFASAYPVYPTLSLKEVLSSNNVENPINWFSVDPSISLEKDNSTNERFFAVLNEKNYQKIFYNKSISGEEAYFYLDIFRGCKFGLSYQQVVENLFNEDFIAHKANFRKPIYFEDSLVLEDFPVIGQANVCGFHFIAKIYNNKYEVVRSDNKILTSKFGILRKLAQYMPNDKKIIINFILQPKEGHDNSELERRLNGTDSIKKANMIILDMYYKGDTACTRKRLNRIEKLVDKCRSLGMNSICVVPYRIIEDQKQLDSFITRMLQKRGAVIIKTNGSFKEKCYKAISQFNTESMMVEDYCIKQINLLNKRDISLDTVTCKTNLGETVFIKNWIHKFEQNIYNIVGKYVRVRWENDVNGKYPYIYGIDLYKMA